MPSKRKCERHNCTFGEDSPQSCKPHNKITIKLITHIKKGKIQFVSSKFISQLNRSDSKLILVFPPAEDKISDALFLGEEMSRNKFGVDEFVMNRAYPVGLDFSKELNIDKDSLEKKIYNYYSKQKSRNLELLKHFKGRQKNAQVDYSIIPELDGSLDSLEDIMRFSNDVERTWEKN